MRKIFIILILFLGVSQVEAQIYFGGSVGLGCIKHEGGDTYTAFKIVPEIGYSLSNNFDIGISVGYKKGSCIIGEGAYSQDVKSKAYGVQPYIRYNAIRIEKIVVFVKGIFTYENIVDEGTNLNLGIKPGVLIRISDHFSIATCFGFCGFEMFKSKGGMKSAIAGVDMDYNNLSFGAYYHF